MNQTTMRNIQRIHFVGIGGAGMGGIAEVLLNQGYTISGSDLSSNVMTNRLSQLGVKVMQGHEAQHMMGAEVLVISSAVKADNPEVVAAKQQHIPVISRAEMLAELMRFKSGIAIAGTHGKTTTTSLVTSLLIQGGLDPTFVIGGLLNSAGANAKLGTGQYIVVEADESDASFLYLKPTIAIVTNIDADHMETYFNNFERLQHTFIEFLHHLPFYGLAVICMDDPNVAKIIPEINRPFFTYGFSPKAHFYATDYVQTGLKTQFVAHRPQGTPLKVTLNLAGKHNVLNALAAITVATELNLSDEAIIQALSAFQGVGRRFQVLGYPLCQNGEFTLIDDYGHHPTEIRETLSAVRAVWPDKRLLHVFQPHRYTRTQALLSEFANVLSGVDQLVLLEVYSAGEAPIAGADGSALCRAVQSCGTAVEPVFVENKATLSSVLQGIVRAGDIVLMQGAGDISTLAHAIADRGKLSD